MRSRLTRLASPFSLTVRTVPSLVFPTYLARPIGAPASAIGAATRRAASAAAAACLREAMRDPESTYLLRRPRQASTLASVGSSPTNEVIRPDAEELRVVEHAALSDVGRERESNEDSFLALPPLFVVADGMGGAQAGEVASQTLVQVFEEAAAAGELPDGLETAVQRANARIHRMAVDDPSRTGMGCTATASYVEGGRLMTAHVGDSRLYRLRGGALEQLTEDHSLVAGLVRLGQLTPEEAEVHPQRSVIPPAGGGPADGGGGGLAHG